MKAVKNPEIKVFKWYLWFLSSMLLSAILGLIVRGALVFLQEPKFDFFILDVASMGWCYLGAKWAAEWQSKKFPGFFKVETMKDASSEVKEMFKSPYSEFKVLDWIKLCCLIIVYPLMKNWLNQRS